MGSVISLVESFVCQRELRRRRAAPQRIPCSESGRIASSWVATGATRLGRAPAEPVHDTATDESTAVSALDDLADRPPRRDHGQDVLLVGDQHVEDVRAGVGDHLLEGIDHLGLRADLAGLDAEPARDRDEVGIDRLGQLALALAGRLGLVDRAQVGVRPVALRGTGPPTARPCPGAGC